MKINLLRPNNTTITLDVSKIDAISGIVDGKFDLYAGSQTYTINSSEYTRVSNVLGTASSGGGGEESGGMEVVYTTERDLTLEPNKYYIFGECSTLNINIGEPTTGGKLNEYRFEFDSGSTPTVLTLPNTVNPSTLNIQEDTKYVISIKNNVLVEVGTQYNDISTFIKYLCNKNITEIVIPEGVTSIPQYMFYQFRSLTKVVLPSTLTDIGNYAFYQCTALSDIDFSNTNLTTIGVYAFSGCTSISSITFPEGFTTINIRAFEGCTALAHVEFPSTLTFIGQYGFVNCSALQSPTFPNSLRTMDAYSFQGCKNFSTITLPNQIPALQVSNFSGCTSLNSITIPTSVTMLAQSCLYGCSALTSLEIPNSVTTIAQIAVQNCASLKEILMYDSVTAITGTNVFAGINTGCRVRILGTNRVIPFMTAIPAAVKFYVDPTMVQAYKTNSAWSARASNIFSLNDYIE